MCPPPATGAVAVSRGPSMTARAGPNAHQLLNASSITRFSSPRGFVNKSHPKPRGGHATANADCPQLTSKNKNEVVPKAKPRQPGPESRPRRNRSQPEPSIPRAATRVYNPTGPVKLPPSDSGLSDRFDRKLVETGQIQNRMCKRLRPV